MTDHHARQLAERDMGQGVTIWVASCSCGWGGKAYTTKRDAAAAWGHHNAAVQRRTPLTKETTRARRPTNHR